LTSRRKTPDFEANLAQLEAIVAMLEEGKLSLEDALARFEQGVRITRQCQQALREAEQRVMLLTQGDANGNVVETPFPVASGEAEDA
jgi:exodeoxyribonuclease VII small subunit